MSRSEYAVVSDPTILAYVREGTYNEFYHTWYKVREAGAHFMRDRSNDLVPWATRLLARLRGLRDLQCALITLGVPVEAEIETPDLLIIKNYADHAECQSNAKVYFLGSGILLKRLEASIKKMLGVQHALVAVSAQMFDTFQNAGMAEEFAAVFPSEEDLEPAEDREYSPSTVVF
ncbi:hypothetical protein NLJ89_g5444 [Agrocybe chaxingu]|uniref:Uncharacterized protein n=1 Tax=Agrocybe chaxingu TaxID=84603 RepID=A0A9W8MTL4_9AGAR|nr:hypothetical protein NLJ89_g5444 [Agrocybe chaxingu]